MTEISNPTQGMRPDEGNLGDGEQFPPAAADFGEVTMYGQEPVVPGGEVAPEASRPNFWTGRKKIGAAIAAALVVGGGTAAAFAAADKPHSHPAAVKEVPGRQHGSHGPGPHASHAPSPLPTESSSSAPILVNGKPYSAGKLNPTKPVVVPYSPGKAPTVTDVELLMHNIDVAVTTNNPQDLLYSGISPNSTVGRAIQANQFAYFQREKAQVKSLVRSDSAALSDADVLFDPADPNVVHVMAQWGTDFDRLYSTDANSHMGYGEYTYRLGKRVLTLPNGQHETILAILHVESAKTTEQQWYNGFGQ